MNKTSALPPQNVLVNLKTERYDKIHRTLFPSMIQVSHRRPPSGRDQMLGISLLKYCSMYL